MITAQPRRQPATAAASGTRGVSSGSSRALNALLSNGISGPLVQRPSLHDLRRTLRQLRRRRAPPATASLSGAASSVAGGASAAGGGLAASLQALAAQLCATASQIGAYLPFLPALWHSLPPLSLPSAALIGSALQQGVESGVLGAACAASLKLFLVCIGVGWLVSEGHSPAETAPVLSKVSFNIFIPCMLFAKVAETLVGSQDPTLFVIPLIALCQIIVGRLSAELVSPLVAGKYSRDRKVLGWHPLNPSPGASAIADATAAASGMPAAGKAVTARERPLPKGTLEILRASCSFCNSMTLPLVFLSSLLSGASATRSFGYVALYQLAWSPLLWSLGPRMLHVDESDGSAVGSSSDSPLRNLSSLPRYLWSELQEGGVGQAIASAAAAAKATAVAFGQEALKLLNPPLMGVVLGLLVGLSPLGSVLFPASATTAVNTARWGWELNIVVGAARACMDLFDMLGGATLAVSAVVLGASMFPADSRSASEDIVVTASSLSAAGSLDFAPAVSPSKDKKLVQTGTWRDKVQRLLLLGLSPVDARLLVATFIVRMLIMPVATLAMVKGLASIGWMPIDPVVTLVVLLAGAMPTAQNLVVLLNLDESTEAGAARLADILLRLYALAILPLTLWVTLFVLQLPVPLSSLT